MTHAQLRRMAEHRDSRVYRWWQSNCWTILAMGVALIAALAWGLYQRENLRREHADVEVLSMALNIGCSTQPAALLVVGENEEVLNASLLNVAKQAFQLKEAWRIARAQQAVMAARSLAQSR